MSRSEINDLKTLGQWLELAKAKIYKEKEDLSPSFCAVCKVSGPYND
jgi:hypothetical protein